MIAVELRLALVAIYVFIGAIVLHNSQRKLHAGWLRLLLSLPMVVANQLIPLAFDRDAETILRITTGLSLMWLGNFKASSWLLTWPRCSISPAALG
jgi:hypothetical protein